MQELYTISLLFTGGHRQVNLTFQNKEAAWEAWAKITDLSAASFPIEDNFGTTIMLFGSGPLEGAFLQDTARAHEAGVEISLIQARAQTKANTRAQHDPTIRLGPPQVMKAFG